MSNDLVRREQAEDEMTSMLVWFGLGQILVLPGCFFGLAQITSFGVAVAAFLLAAYGNVASIIWIGSAFNKKLPEDNHHIQYIIIVITLIGFLALLGMGWLYMNIAIQASFGEGT